jgi:hypothetical protein
MEEFDPVIIAAPFHFNGIGLDELSIESINTPLAPYIGAHVTHFTSEE